MSLTALSDVELLENLKSLIAREQGLLARILTYLIAVEDRRIHLLDSGTSLFDFCTRRLRMSEGEAFRRIAAARLVRRFPSILGCIERGEINLSALVLLRNFLTEDNCEDLLERAKGKTKIGVQELIANRFPRPDVPSQIRKLPNPASVTAMRAQSVDAVPSTSVRVLMKTDAKDSTVDPRSAAPSLFPLSVSSSSSSASSTLQLAPEIPSLSSGKASLSPSPSQPNRMRPPAHAKIEPLAGSRHKVQFTADDELRRKLERATDLMRHRNPTGDLAVVVERALDLLIEKIETESQGKTSRPKANPRPAKDTRITSAVRRAVFKRDGEQCSFVSKGGERCPSRAFLELDHVRPRALGGASSVENLRLLCAAHNHLLAEEVFGRQHVDEQIRLRRQRSAKRRVRSLETLFSPRDQDPTHHVKSDDDHSQLSQPNGDTATATPS